MNSNLQFLAEESLINGLINYDKKQGWRGPIGNINEDNIKFEELIKKIGKKEKQEN